MGLAHLLLGTLVGGLLGAGLVWKKVQRDKAKKYSIGDQVARFEAAKRRNDQRVLNIDKFYEPGLLKGKVVLVVGASRGLGFATCKALVDAGAITFATTRKPTPELTGIGVRVIDGIDTTSDESMVKLCNDLNMPLDILITNAGYFYGPVETVQDHLNFKEESKMIEICAIGSFRVAAALVRADLVKPGCGKIALITSQAGSIAWREEQNPEGDNYGHHMSRSATNMMGRLLSFELGHTKKIAVQLLHPGFNKTEMTAKYAEIWEKEGAVDPSVGAKRVLHEINRMSLTNSGKFINCEDGLEIPW